MTLNPHMSDISTPWQPRPCSFVVTAGAAVTYTVIVYADHTTVDEQTGAVTVHDAPAGAGFRLECASDAPVQLVAVAAPSLTSA